MLRPKIGPASFFKHINEDFEINSAAYEIINECKKQNIKIIPYYDKKYPQELLKIHNYPPLLFAKGDIELLNQTCVSIVGSRSASIIGLKTAYEWSKELSNDFVIVSGLARGIDSSAYEGATKKCISVIPNGIFRFNRQIQGLILSEMLPYKEATLASFAMRNRIISGMSKVILIIEAKIKSGTMRTAKMAIEQNRALYVVPGHPNDLHYSGNNFLLQNHNAKIALSHNDIYNFLTKNNRKSKSIKIKKTDFTIEDKVCDLLSTVPIHISEIANSLNLSMNEMQVIITKTQMKYESIHVSEEGYVSKLI